jgi:parvulin-like peptidyl-prolyl isomerase
MRCLPLPTLAAALAATVLLTSACTDLTAPRGEDPANLGQLPSKQHPQGASQNPEMISASHILIAHKGSRKASAKITRSKEEARALAEKVATQAKSGDFEALAKTNSDDPGSGSNGGKLGSFSRESMTKKFSEAAFQLAVGQVSGVVETEFGFHIIKRTQ